MSAIVRIVTPAETAQLATQKRIWDFLPEEGETPAAFQAFVTYRDGPRPRNIGKLADAAGYARDTYYMWSTDFCWAGRVDEYDKHLDQVAQAATETEVAARARAALRTCNLALLVADEALKQLLSDLLAKQGVVSASQAARLLREAVVLARLIDGQATERVESTADLSKLSDEELAALEVLEKKTRGVE